MSNSFSLVEEECFPYESGKQSCPHSYLRAKTLDEANCHARRNVSRIEFYKVGPAYSLRNETDIMIEIYKFGPVQGI